ncbi:zf-CCHC domain-containing protein [Tanacetum coccineum]
MAPKITAIEESKDLSTLPLDELIGNLKVYEVVLEKDSETSRNKKEKYKSLALKARKVLSEEEATSSDSNDEEYAMTEDKKEKDDRRCFKCGDLNHFISDCPKHSFNDQKAFVVGCWSDSDDDSRKEEICLMALDDNAVLSDTPYYSSSSLDNESWQNEYDKLCKISLRIINKNKQLKAKNEELKKEACELKTRVEQLERNKKISLKSKMENAKNLGNNIVKKNDSVLITRKSTFNNSKSVKQRPILKPGQGLGKSKIQTHPRTPYRNSNTLYPKSNYHKVGWDYGTQQEYQFQPPMFHQWGPCPPFLYMGQPNVKLEPDEWIKDSGCSRHMTSNKDLFSSYKTIDGGNVVFGGNTKSKIVEKDHGQEFDNEVQFGAFCDANGITHNFSAPRTPQSNRVVKRKYRTLQEMTKTMLNE